MKQVLPYICLLLFFTSCVSDRPWYAQGDTIKVSDKAKNYFAPLDSEKSYPMDSSLYVRLLDEGTSEYCAMVTAFTMSEVEMTRQLPNRCHRQTFYFEDCSAYMLDDTVFVEFKTQNPRRSMASNKIMKVKVLDNEHVTQIIHWGSEFQEITHLDGSTSMRKAPSSSIVSTRLKLNKPHYELGDTIIGELKVSAVQYKGKRRAKVKEEVAGRFRAIVGGYNLDCTIEETLAHSWLR